MKTIKYIVLTILSISVLGVLSSCNNPIEEDMPVEPLEPRVISLGFEGLILTPNPDGFSAKSDPLHTYITDGYTIRITGAIDPSDAYLTDIDLNEGVSVVVTGDIVMTVSHPNFSENSLQTEAFYGVQDYPVATGSNDVNVVSLELVQGFVMVTSDENAESFIKEVRIAGHQKELDVVYYTNLQQVEVRVATYDHGELRGSHTTVIGEGVQYNVSISGDGIAFEFPEFGTPGDGEWVP